jgi:hypothetical protein
MVPPSTASEIELVGSLDSGNWIGAELLAANGKPLNGNTTEWKYH